MKTKHLLVLTLISIFLLSLFAYMASAGIYWRVPSITNTFENSRAYKSTAPGANFSGRSLAGPAGTHSIINLSAWIVEDAIAFVGAAQNTSNLTEMNFSWSNTTELYRINITVRNTTAGALCQTTANLGNCSEFINQTASGGRSNYIFNGSFLNEGQYNVTIFSSNYSGDANPVPLNTSMINIRIDSSAPNLTFANASNMTTQTLSQTSGNNINLSGGFLGAVAVSEAKGCFKDSCSETERGNNTNTGANQMFSINITVTDFNVTVSQVFANISNFSMAGLAADLPSGNNYSSGLYLGRRLDPGAGADGNPSLEKANTSDVRASHHRYSFNLSFNLSELTEGPHNITFIANDSVNNVNNTGQGTPSGGSPGTHLVLNFTVDRTAPTVVINNASTITGFKTQNKSAAISFNFSDTLSKVANCQMLGNSTYNENVVLKNMNSTINATNTTIYANHTLADGNYLITVNCTDAAGNMGNSSYRVNVTIDTTAPSITVSKSTAESTSLTLSIATSSDARTCTVDRNSATITGTGATQTLKDSGLAPATSYTYSVQCADDIDNKRTVSATFSTDASSGGSSGGSGGGVSSGSSKAGYAKVVWTSLEPAKTATVEVENGEIGATKVEFQVAEEVFGVWVNVQKVDALPAEVPALEQKVYKYLEVKHHLKLTEDLVTEGKIFFNVNKAWLDDNGLSKNNIALYRSVEGQWNELPTTITNEEEELVHYEATTPGFSFFAIGQSTAPVAGPTVPPVEIGEGAVAGEGAEEEAVAFEAEGAGGVSAWVWVIALVVIAGVAFFLISRRVR